MQGNKYSALKKYSLQYVHSLGWGKQSMAFKSLDWIESATRDDAELGDEKE